MKLLIIKLQLLSTALLLIHNCEVKSQIVPNGTTTPAATTQTLPTTPSAYTSVPSNIIRTWAPSRPYILATNVRNTSRTVEEVKLQNQYFDGLGRPLQTVARGLSAGGNDLVTPYIYDNMGREQFQYLSYSAAAATDGSIKTSVFSDQNSAIKSIYNPSNLVNGEQFFFAKTNYETAPLGREIKKLPQGNSWAGSDRGTSISYAVNATNEVRSWTIGDGEGDLPSSSVFYTAGMLQRTVYTNEEGKINIEYKDKLNRIICSKVQLTATDVTLHDGWLCTYYVYDRANNLRCMITPRAIELLPGLGWSFGGNPALLNSLCYWRWYDSRNRVRISKYPGRGPARFVYDGLDRLVMYQDSALQMQGKWMVNKYDAWNRIVATYRWDNSQSRADHEAAAASSTDYPTLSGTYELLTENYYDAYTWVSSSGSGLPSTFTSSEASSGFYSASDDVAPYARALTPNYNVKGLLTGSREKILGTSSYIYSVIFYDKDGRPIQTQTKNITGGIDIATTQYSFDDKKLIVKENRNATGMTPANVIIITTNIYDAGGRLSEIKKKINSDPEVTIVKNAYNEVGQIVQKKLGQQKVDDSYSTDPVETLDYNYNVRGWLTAINPGFIGDANTSRAFGMQLDYDYGYNVPDGGYFAGNIAGMRWRSAGDKELRSQGFAYDAAKRILKADFTQYNGSWNTSAGVDFSMKVGDGSTATTAYDLNGNILGLDQKGWTPGGSNTIDSLLYTYQSNSNFISNIIDRRNDTATRLGDFRSSRLYMTALSNNKTTAATDYVYDVNGNLISDRNKDLGDGTNNGIVYNHLNLPEIFTFRTTAGAVRATVTYVYDASGNKLRKVTEETGYAGINTTYLNGLVYQNDTLQLIQHEGGRVIYIPAGGSSSERYEYNYFVTDHLGNTRAVLSEVTATDPYPQLTFEGTTGTTEVVEQDSYWEDKDGQSLNVTGVRTARPGAFGTAGSNGSYVILSRKSTGAIGATKLLKVMAGDRIHTSVEYFFTVANADNTPANGISSLVSSLASSLLTASTVPGMIKAGTSSITTPMTGNAGLVSLLNTPANASGGNQAPKAYLNILFFDERFVFDETSSIVVPVEYLPNQKGTIDKRLANAVLAKKSGYAYIYFSNESDEIVYFDNFMLTHERGRLLEESHYYPHGLLMAGISSKAFGRKGNKYLFHGKELQSRELANGDGIEGYDYGARTYDPQVGRWNQVDPMADQFPWQSGNVGFDNNPVVMVDPTGKSASPIYDVNGNFLGTDDQGVAGAPIILEAKDFTQGMSHEQAVKKNKGGAGLVDAAAIRRLATHFVNLPTRPDFDGYVSISEGVEWARSHPGAMARPNADNMLYIDASQLNFGNLTVDDLKGSTRVNLFNVPNTINSIWNSELRSTVYALGRVNITLEDAKKRTVRVVNNDATDYDWNGGGGTVRSTFIWAELIRTGLPDNAGFRTYYYGIGKLEVQMKQIMPGIQHGNMP